MRETALLSILFALGCIQTAAAAPLKLRDSGLSGYARSDGVKYLAISSDSHVVTVVDTITQARRTIPAPAGDCTFRDIHRGTLLWSCANEPPQFDRGVTYDLATRQVRALPQLQLTGPNTATFGAEAASYAEIGDHWAKATYSGYHIGVPAYIQRDSGQPQAISPGADSVVDLDAASLTRALCDGQRRPALPNDGYDITGSLFGDLATAGDWAATTNYPATNRTGDDRQRVTLQHCGSTPRPLKVCRRVVCGQPVINDRIVAWVETKRLHTVRLVVRSLRTGRTRASTTRAYRGTATPLLVGSRLYLTSGTRLLGVAL
jgi:hypothetical protein